MFQSGHDFFHDLPEFGVVHPVDVWPPEARLAAEAVFLAAAKDAWHRLGGAFMATWQPNAARDTPWAVEQFGESINGN